MSNPVKLHKQVIRLEKPVEVSIRRQNLIHILYKLVLSFVFNLFKCSNLIPVNLIHVLLQRKKKKKKKNNPAAKFQLVKRQKNTYLENFKSIDVQHADIDLLVIFHHGFVDGLKSKDWVDEINVYYRLSTIFFFSYEDALNCTNMRSYLDQEVKHSWMQGFGEGVTGVTRLLHVKSHIDGLHRVSPLAVHLPARQFLL